MPRPLARLADIELIAFLDPSRVTDRAKHWWGPKHPGWIDWSLSPAPETTESVLASIRAQAGGEGGEADIFDAPNPGGRKTTDDKELRWIVTFPRLEEGQKRGVRPFWCEDVTPREWRVSPPCPCDAMRCDAARGPGATRTRPRPTQ